MKRHSGFFFCFLLLFGAAFSIAAPLKFEWNLKHSGNILMRGWAIHFTRATHSDLLCGCDNGSSDLDCLTRSCVLCIAHDFAIYEVASFTNIDFSENTPGITIPVHLFTLLGDGYNNLHHRFNTRYMLRGQSTTLIKNFAELFCYFFCCPCYVFYQLTPCVARRENNSKLNQLTRAVPNHLPEHISIARRTLLHRATRIHDNQMLGSSDTVVDDDSAHIFDLFLNTPEAQQWVRNNLYSTNNLTLSVVIPELFNTAVSARILIQNQSDSDIDSGIMTPTHFITFNIDSGITIQYHLNQLSPINIQVLAIVITTEGYTLTLNVNGYDVIANQPPPNYADVSTMTCNCNGACACSHFEKNDTDNSGGQNGGRGYMFFSDCILKKRELNLFNSL